ncbi:MAG: hypothetical protein ACM3SQ_18445 [Betaproteobacteria bacterium]
MRRTFGVLAVLFASGIGLVASTLATIVLVPVPAAGQALSDVQIEAAIAAGRTRKPVDLVVSCTATIGFGTGIVAGIAGGRQPTGAFSVAVSDSEGRIAALAFQARRVHEPFTKDNVSGDLKRQAVFVTVEPNAPARSDEILAVPSPIESVVLQSRQQREAVARPLRIGTEPVEWSDRLGDSITSNRAAALFSLDSVRGLPPGDVDVVVLTEAGERRCTIPGDDRGKILK